MFQLRQTWNDVFPIQKLSALDVQVSAIDPNWPIVSPPKIHLNPNFHPTVVSVKSVFYFFFFGLSNEFC